MLFPAFYNPLNHRTLSCYQTKIFAVLTFQRPRTISYDHWRAVFILDQIWQCRGHVDIQSTSSTESPTTVHATQSFPTTRSGRNTRASVRFVDADTGREVLKDSDNIIYMILTWTCNGVWTPFPGLDRRLIGVKLMPLYAVAFLNRSVSLQLHCSN